MSPVPCNVQTRSNTESKKFNDGREDDLHAYIFSPPRGESLRGDPIAVLNAIQDFTQSKTPMMTLTPHKIDVFHDQLVTLQAAGRTPKVIVELGTYVGNSAVALGSMLKELHGNDTDKTNRNDDGLRGCKVFSLELDAHFVDIARDLVDLAGLSDLVQIVHGPAADSVRKLHKEGVLDQIDVLLLDHWEKFYLPDLQVCEDLGLLKKGGLVVADNTDKPGAPDYVEYVKKGGREGKGWVRYESRTLETTEKKGFPVSLNSGISWIAPH